MAAMKFAGSPVRARENRSARASLERDARSSSGRNGRGRIEKTATRKGSPAMAAAERIPTSADGEAQAQLPATRIRKENKEPEREPRMGCRKYWWATSWGRTRAHSP